MPATDSMRSYSAIEKQFISFLVKSERGQRKLMSFLDAHLERTKIRVDLTKDYAEYRFEVGRASDEVFGWIINKVEDLQEIVAVLVSLLGYLQAHGYIASYKVTPDVNTSVHEFGRGIDANLKLSSPFPDQDIERLVIDYAFKEIVPLDPLCDLNAHDFVAPEDRRFRTQYWQTNVAIVLAFVVGAAGIWLSYCALKQQNASSAEQSENEKASIAATEAGFAAGLDRMKDIQSSLMQIEMAIQSSSKSGHNKALKSDLGDAALPSAP